ncbi:hypothetical protein CDN99_11660 [Roseateles aquatilis]|uniref:Uncharacterized protein n=1 Tax=Roseateles aquatilis TaxID=431061 RepID=A0A246JE86_9BURK|nr:hypothetical protein [Roseateles aquatilis]OWQ90817.1 hypothetical protein CDN99_11660 [Roseateles aquatilis]
MSKERLQIYAEIPSDLQQADQLLHRYGRWAMDRWRAARCGSAEGRYRAPGGEALEARRLPLESLTGDDAMQVQEAMKAVGELERQVLTILYVPQRLPSQAQLRMQRIPPQLSQVRHLAGLRAFWSHHSALTRRGRGGVDVCVACRRGLG